MEIYSVENLSFSYPEQQKRVLEKISFSVNEGEFLVFGGLSGSGKSTLLRHLKTALRPYGKTDGIVKYKGRPLDETDELTQAREIGFVMQSPDNQSVTDKVWHELAFGLENLGVPQEVIKRRTAEIASFFDLDVHKKISELSGGQKQILNLASVMIMEPSVLILDEPTAQLDPISAEEFIRLLSNIRERFGTTVILCEHTLEDVCTLSDRIIIMEDGKVISDAEPKKTAIFLCEKNNVLIESMPVSAKIYSCCEKQADRLPLTVESGRRWLSGYCKDKLLLPVIHSYSGHDKSDVPAVSVKNVFYRYERLGNDVLKGTSLKAWHGEILSILGANGSGKTTLLHTIAGIIKPYSGSIKTDGSRIGFLTQDPKTVFLKDTLENDLYEIFGTKEKTPEQKAQVDKIMRLCGLEEMRDRHPYDLSGGEQQKAAIAKILLMQPSVLLLDEPVKGMDVKAKSEIGEILRVLKESGVCVILVSHDTDFCAEYSDKCALFFDGELIGTDTPESFFSTNVFFTTAARRMSAKIIENAVTSSDIKKALSIPEIKRKPPDYIVPVTDKSTSVPQNKKKLSLKSIFHIFTSVLFLLSAAAVIDLFGIRNYMSNMAADYAVMLISAGLLIFYGIKSGRNESLMIKRIQKPARLTVVSVILIIAAIPFTIFVGVKYLGDAKYIFISLLIMLECTVPFFAMFENKHIRTRELVIISVMCAMAVTARAAFYMLPQFKPITAVIIIAGAALGAESGFMIGSMSMLVSNIIFGQGPWTPWQMFSMGIIGFLAGILFGRNILPRNKLTFCIFGFLSALLIYGGIMNPAAMILSHIEPTFDNVLMLFATGLPLDTVHALSTAIFLYFGAEPVLKKIERVKLKYGLVQ